MSSNDQQLAALGQQVIDQLVAAYNPDDNPEQALAVVPGRPVQDPLQVGGDTNPLVVSQWLRTDYDDPLLLRLADCTPLSVTIGSGLPGSVLYTLAAQNAVPAGDPDSPAAQRVARMVATARTDLGPDPAVLPLGCEPSGWALPGGTIWQAFDSVVHAAETTHTEVGSSPVKHVNPSLWKLRALPEAALDVSTVPPPRVIQYQQLRAAALQQELDAAAAVPDRTELLSPLAVKRYSVQRLPLMEMTVQREPAEGLVQERLGLRSELAQRFSDGPVSRMSSDSVVERIVNADAAVSAAEVVTAPPTAGHAVDPALLRYDVRQLAPHFDLSAVEQAPAVDAVTTTSTDLHVHFEHCLVTITRTMSGRSWMHQELLHDDGWFIHGMRRGELVPEPTVPGTAHCLPRALLLMRGLEVTGTWTAEARAALSSGVPALGPFLLQPMEETVTANAVQQTVVHGLGMQVVGVLATPLPVLPPLDDPDLDPPDPAPTP